MSDLRDHEQFEESPVNAEPVDRLEIPVIFVDEVPEFTESLGELDCEDLTVDAEAQPPYVGSEADEDYLGDVPDVMPRVLFSTRTDLPSVADLEAELKRAKGKKRYRKAFFGVLGALLVASAIAVLVATRFLPVLQIYGDSMTPTLYEGEIVAAFDYGDLEQGDVIAFYYNNKVLVKRVIAGPGDWVDIKDDGTIFVNNRELNEPYVDEFALGSCNIILPYQVPESHVFVMGDHRASSIDSRNTAVGCVGEDQIIGELVVRVWPIDKIGLL